MLKDDLTAILTVGQQLDVPITPINGVTRTENG